MDDCFPGFIASVPIFSGLGFGVWGFIRLGVVRLT